ncbi:MAG: hypothetical protein ACLTV6_00465 [Christensenellales bacterium]
MFWKRTCRLTASREEHELLNARSLVERQGSRMLSSWKRHALSLRLWASIGVVGDKPYIELEKQFVNLPRARFPQ